MRLSRGREVGIMSSSLERNGNSRRSYRVPRGEYMKKRYAYYIINDPLPAELWIAVRYDVFIEEESDG